MSADFPTMRLLAEGDIHHVDLPLRWGDSDSLNHLNNTVYFRLMEEARMRILYGAGMQLPGPGAGAILAHASCDFMRPLTYPADVRVTHRVARIGRSSIEFELTLEKLGDEAGIYARGRNVLVCMDFVANRSQPWPEELLRKFGAQFRPAG
ncbi:thioesterase [Bordetella ansorpii]|uniref:Thioesterase n=1 Tax=Bordetella ansorpii TaxID=288768 RepID=A0A157MMK6_9BORD|nr:thioesterase [Bordetella ansorpii]